MNHRFTFDDVQNAFARYQRVTGDNLATLERGSDLVIRLCGEWNRTFYGAATACLGIECYCDGYGHGREDGVAEPHGQYEESVGL